MKHQSVTKKIAKPYGVFKKAFALFCNVRLFQPIFYRRTY
jgi:hypothetical protein